MKMFEKFKVIVFTTITPALLLLVVEMEDGGGLLETITVPLR